MDKECVRCHKIKPHFEFHAESDRPLGLNSWCKDCYKKYKREYYLAHQDEIIAYSRQYKLEHRHDDEWRKEQKREADKRRAIKLIQQHHLYYTMFICEVCEKEFDVRNCEVRRKEKRGQKVRWCSNNCQGTWLGKNHGWGKVSA